MTAEPETIILGGRDFEAPATLPLGVTILVYPICQKLTNAGLISRLTKTDDGLGITVEEMGDLTEVAFHLAHAADPDLDTKAFLDLPVTPAELFVAFFAARIRCGGWRRIEATAEDRDDQGEALGTTASPTSTSQASSPA